MLFTARKRYYRLRSIPRRGLGAFQRLLHYPKQLLGPWCFQKTNLHLLLERGVVDDGASTLLSGDAEAALEILSLRSSTDVASGEQVELIFVLIGFAVEEVEDDTRSECNDSNGAVVPHEVRVSRQRSESLTEGGRESSGEGLDGHDHTPHILGCLGESVLEGGDRCENLGPSNEDINASDSPDIDGRPVVRIMGVIVARGLVTTGFVSVVH